MLARDTEDLLRRLDRRILYPVLAAYCCSYVDRSNISNALTSLERSIGLTPRHYALSAALFTISLVLVEIPSNAILKYVGPRTWLATLVAGCGACTILQGSVGSWQALVGVRTILGLFEGGVFPGALYALTLYYPPEHLTVRISAFTLAASFAFAAGAFLAGILLPWGAGGWRALFILQGALTLGVSVVLYGFLPIFSTRASSELNKVMVEGGTAEDEEESESRARSSGAAVDPPAFLPAHLRALFSLIHTSPPLSPATSIPALDRTEHDSSSRSSFDELAVRSVASRWALTESARGGHLVHRSRETSPTRSPSEAGVWRPTASALKASSTTTTPLLTMPAEEAPPGSATSAAKAYFTAPDNPLLDVLESRPASRSASAAPSTATLSSSSIAAAAASSVSTTLLSPLTWVLSIAYLFLLLATTPSTFLPRLLSARWALSESAANTAVGVLYTIGGLAQFAVGYIAGRSDGPGLLSTWRRAAAATVGCWVLVAAFEVALRGEGVVALSASENSGGNDKEMGGWDWVGSPAARWTGILLRLAATMATPTLGSLYLSHTVSLPTSLVPNRAILTACVISIGNLAQALGPPLYASCLPLLASPAFPGGTPTPTPDAPLPPDDVPHFLPRQLLTFFFARTSDVLRKRSTSAAAASTIGFEFWRGLAARDLAMGLAVLIAWAAVEVVSRYAAGEASRQRHLIQQQKQHQQEGSTGISGRRGRTASIDASGRPFSKDNEREEQAGLLARDPS